MSNSNYPNRAERRSIKKSFNKKSIKDFDLIRKGTPEARRLMSTLPLALKDIPFDIAIKACKWAGEIQLRHGYDHATKKQTSTHEAGHIVVAQALGIQTTGSRIWNVNGRWNGFTSWNASYSTSTAKGLFLRNVIALAGWRAEILGKLDHPASSLDERFLVKHNSALQDLSHNMPQGTAMHAVEQFTDRILGRYKASLNRLANALIEKADLTEIEIEDLLDAELNDKKLQKLVISKFIGGVIHA